MGLLIGFALQHSDPELMLSMALKWVTQPGLDLVMWPEYGRWHAASAVTEGSKDTEWCEIPRDLARHLTHLWSLGDLGTILNMQFSMLLYWVVSSCRLIMMPSDECHDALLLMRQYWQRWWLGAVRQQPITCANVDQDITRHMASPGHDELYLLNYGNVYEVMKKIKTACTTA